MVDISRNAGIGGSIPQITRMPDTPGVKPLFHSVRDIALILDKTVASGYGVLNIGTLMSVCAYTGNLVPYPEALVTVNRTNAKAYLTVATADAAKIIYTTIADSYKFEVGQSLIIDCSAAVDSQDLGAITAIDRTYANATQAKITLTTNLSDGDGDFTVANSVCVYAKGGDTSHPFTKAVYVLDKDIDTGVGEYAKGANTSVVVSNAILYATSLIGYDAAAATDLGTTADGRFVILK